MKCYCLLLHKTRYDVFMCDRHTNICQALTSEPRKMQLSFHYHPKKVTTQLITESRKLINTCHIHKSCKHLTIIFSLRPAMVMSWLRSIWYQTKANCIIKFILLFVFTYFHLIKKKNPL